MSDELEKLRTSIKKSVIIIKTAKGIVPLVIESQPEKEQTETELPDQTEEPDQNVSPEPEF